MSAASYSDLACHEGHDITVAIYGGDASANVECETCNIVLLDFERVPDATRAADLAALVALAERHRIGEVDLDEAVHDAAARQGCQANNEGVQGQIEYLIDHIGTQAARGEIEQAATERARR
jgi:hypothetical protein